MFNENSHSDILEPVTSFQSLWLISMTVVKHLWKEKRIKYCSEVHVAIDRYLKEKLHAVQSWASN